MRGAKTQVDDLSRSLIAFEQNSTMVVVREMSQSSWLTRVRPAGMDSGWPVGCALAVSSLLSSIRRASRCHASVAGQRRIASTPKRSFVCS